jgi:hypothetical protein
MRFPNGACRAATPADRNKEGVTGDDSFLLRHSAGSVSRPFARLGLESVEGRAHEIRQRREVVPAFEHGGDARREP